MGETTDRDSAAPTGSTPFTHGDWYAERGEVWNEFGDHIGTAWEKTPVDETQAEANAVLMAAAKELADSTRALLTLTNPFLTHSEGEAHRIRRDAERLLERIGIEL